MTVDVKFLRDVQSAGWVIRAVDQGGVLAGCPRSGCALKVKLRQGARIPDTCRPGPDLAEVTVGVFDDARVFLRQRRNDLALNIKEVEEVAGITVDYLAKFEKDNPSKIPNAQTFIEWAQSLGYAVVLRPDRLPVYALRTITDTRAVAASRIKMQAHHQARREGVAQSGQG